MSHGSRNNHDPNDDLEGCGCIVVILFLVVLTYLFWN